MKLDEKCESCFIINKGIDCPMYNDCLLELRLKNLKLQGGGRRKHEGSSRAASAAVPIHANS